MVVKRGLLGVLLCAVGATWLCGLGPWAAAGTAQVAARFQRGTVEAKSWSGPIQGKGPWEFVGDVKLTTDDLVLTCDRLRIWLTSDGRHWERVEAAGHLAVTGTYVAADKTEWRVSARAETAVYDAKAMQAKLKGGVQFRATSQATGATITALADVLTYDIKTERFRFERGDQPVQVQWAQPEGASGRPSPTGGEGK